MKYESKRYEPATVILSNYLSIVNPPNPTIILDNKIEVLIENVGANNIIKVRKEFIDEPNQTSYIYTFELIPNYFIDPNSVDHRNHILKEVVRVLGICIQEHPCYFVESPPNFAPSDCIIHVLGV